MANRWISALVLAACFLVVRVQVQAACLGDDGDWDVKAPGRTPSHKCLVCHDGIDAPFVPSAAQSLWSPAAPGDHPTEVSYYDAWRRNPEGYVAPMDLDSRITLPNGRVVCLSCHDGSSAEPNALVFSNSKSALCLACHNK